jgi:non-heme chloroperoxidase
MKHSSVFKLALFPLCMAVGTVACSRLERLQIPHGNVRFIKVDDDVKLEVVDWGGSGRPLVLLAGLGGNAHTFARFAPKLTPKYHVFSDTRRGFVPSSIPNSGYSADRLGDDIVVVIDTLGLQRPVLAGHSIAGEELSSIGTRHPGKVAGLIYVDAGYSYALYDSVLGDLHLDAVDAIRELERLQPGVAGGRPNSREVVEKLVQLLPQLEKELESESRRKDLLATANEPALRSRRPATFDLGGAIFAGEQKFTNIPGPSLAIFAIPHDPGPGSMGGDIPRARREAQAVSRVLQQSDTFQRQVPSARVVRIADASHMVFESNEEQVLKEMSAFIDSLP